MFQHELDCVLVGGGCVSIHSRNRYQSYDLDYVTYEDLKLVSKALAELGFQKKGRYFMHAKSEYFVEFVAPPVAIGKERALNFENHVTPIGTIKMLTPTDSVKDRLVSFYYWEDTQALDQALDICKEASNSIDIANIKKWSKREGYMEKFAIFIEQMKNLKKSY